MDSVSFDAKKSWWKRRSTWLILAVLGLIAVFLIQWTGSTSSTSDNQDSPQAKQSNSGQTTSPTKRPSAKVPTIPVATDASGKRAARKPVLPNEAATPARGVTIVITKSESVAGKTVIPGEVGGPSVRLSLKITNDARNDLDITSAVVNLYSGKDRVPATGLLEPGGRPFPRVVPAGESVTGVYVFELPQSARDRVRIEIDLAAQASVVYFEGSIA